MADNFAYTPGSGEVGGADDIGGVKYPRIKLIYGADGVNSGDVATANPLPTVDAAAAAAIAALQTAVETGDSQLPPALGPQTAEASLSVVGRGYISDITVTRPANTTAYAAGDVVGGAITFTAAGPTGDHCIITSADLSYNVAAIPGGMSSFRLHLYGVTPPSATADNAAWGLPAGDRASYLGYIDLGSVADVGDTLYAQAQQINMQIKLTAARTSIFGYLVTNGGYTPAATSETFKVRLRSVGL